MTAAGAVVRLNAALCGESQVDSDLVQAIVDALGFPVTDVRIAMRGALRALNAPVTPLEMRTDTWRIDLEGATIKAVSCATVTTLILNCMGAPSIPATVLSIVAPFLFEIERIEISADDVWVHGRLLEAASGDAVHLPELYERLPGDVRDELTVRDFIAIIERLQHARLLSVGPDGVVIHPIEQQAGFALRLRLASFPGPRLPLELCDRTQPFRRVRKHLPHNPEDRTGEK